MTSDNLIMKLSLECERLANKYEPHPELPDDNSFSLSELYVDVQNYLDDNIKIEYDEALNLAAWEITDQLEKYAPLAPVHWNNIKECLKVAIEKYLTLQGKAE